MAEHTPCLCCGAPVVPKSSRNPNPPKYCSKQCKFKVNNRNYYQNVLKLDPEWRRRSNSRRHSKHPLEQKDRAFFHVDVQPTETQHCAVCKAAFEPLRSPGTLKLYCSPTCARYAKRRRERAKMWAPPELAPARKSCGLCPYCDGPVLPPARGYVPNKIYCSPLCQRRARAERRCQVAALETERRRAARVCLDCSGPIDREMPKGSGSAPVLCSYCLDKRSRHQKKAAHYKLASPFVPMPRLLRRVVEEMRGGPRPAEELARRLGVKKSTVHRYASALVKRGEAVRIEVPWSDAPLLVLAGEERPVLDAARAILEAEEAHAVEVRRASDGLQQAHASLKLVLAGKCPSAENLRRAHLALEALLTGKAPAKVPAVPQARPTPRRAA